SSHYFSPPSSPTEEHRGLHRTQSGFSQRRRRSTQTSRPPDDAIVSGDRLDGENKEDEAEHLTSDEEGRKREGEVLGLARKLTSYPEESPFDAGTDSKLNPHSKNFSAKAWAKAMLDTHLGDPKAYPLRTAGLAFRDLNVFGYGVSTDYQMDVFNVG